MTWVYLIIMIVAMLAAAALAPKPKEPKPKSLEDLDAPTAEDGREVMDVCGTVWIDDPNVIWYGDLYTKPIRTDGGK